MSLIRLNDDVIYQPTYSTTNCFMRSIAAHFLSHLSLYRISPEEIHYRLNGGELFINPGRSMQANDAGCSY